MLKGSTLLLRFWSTCRDCTVSNGPIPLPKPVEASSACGGTQAGQTRDMGHTVHVAWGSVTGLGQSGGGSRPGCRRARHGPASCQPRERLRPASPASRASQQPCRQPPGTELSRRTLRAPSAPQRRQTAQAPPAAARPSRPLTALGGAACAHAHPRQRDYNPRQRAAHARLCHPPFPVARLPRRRRRRQDGAHQVGLPGLDRPCSGDCAPRPPCGFSGAVRGSGRRERPRRGSALQSRSLSWAVGPPAAEEAGPRPVGGRRGLCWG